MSVNCRNFKQAELRVRNIGYVKLGCLFLCSFLLCACTTEGSSRLPSVRSSQLPPAPGQFFDYEQYVQAMTEARLMMRTPQIAISKPVLDDLTDCLYLALVGHLNRDEIDQLDAFARGAQNIEMTPEANLKLIQAESEIQRIGYRDFSPLMAYCPDKIVEFQTALVR